MCNMDTCLLCQAARERFQYHTLPRKLATASSGPSVVQGNNHGPDVQYPACPAQELVQVESLAQMGVQLLLFTLGLEFSLSKLKAVRSVALAGGMIQITAFMILAGLLATFIGASVHEGVFIGALVRGPLVAYTRDAGPGAAAGCSVDYDRGIISTAGPCTVHA